MKKCNHPVVDTTGKGCAAPSGLKTADVRLVYNNELVHPRLSAATASRFSFFVLNEHFLSRTLSRFCDDQRLTSLEINIVTSIISGARAWSVLPDHLRSQFLADRLLAFKFKRLILSAHRVNIART